MRVTAFLVVLVVVLAIAVLVAQTPASEPTFDVVSVKPVGGPTPSPPGTNGFLPGGRYVASYTNILNLFGVAYRPSGFGSLGLDHIDATHVPDWISTATLFRIEGRVTPPPPGWGREEVGQPYLRSLLRDRFKLETHFEKRALPAYWMTVAKADGTLGPNMKASATALECAERVRLAAGLDFTFLDWTTGSSFTIQPQNAGPPVCAIMSRRRPLTNIAGGNVSVAMLARALREPLGAPVFDHTGVIGAFDVNVSYSLQAPSDPASAGNIAEWPTLITAVREQLGLKLERHTEPQDVLVVDHIERPSED